MRNLFIVHTPYHLILASGLCKKDKVEKNDILIYKDFDLSSIDMKNIESIFSNVYLYDKNSYIKVNIPKLKTIFMIKSKLKNINRLIKFSYNKIFVFNESLIETQYILNKKIVDEKSEIIYVEDGSNAYIKTIHGEKCCNIKSVIRDYLYYGFRYEDVGHTFGIHSKIQKRLFVWPGSVRDELKNDNIPIEEIKKDVLEYGIKCCYNNQIRNISIDRNGIFILLEHLEFFSMNKDASIEKYKEVIEKIIVTLSSRVIYIKYHPRDKSNYLKDTVDKYENIKIIENSQPAEIYYISKDISIVSVFSTTLFTAAKILSDMKIISLAKIMNIKDEELINKFIDIGVNMPNNCRDVIEIITKK